jgi:hypothetical protein
MHSNNLFTSFRGREGGQEERGPHEGVVSRQNVRVEMRMMVIMKSANILAPCPLEGSVIKR